MRDFIEEVAKPFLAAAILTILSVSFAVGVAMAVVFLSTPADASPRYLAIAKSYIGLKEGTKKANKAMGVNTRKVPWCGYFIKAVVTKAGDKPVQSYPSAAAWKSYGTKVSLKTAMKGDIVVLKPGKRHHVGIYSHKDNGRVCIVGGNQSNSVKLSCYKASLVKAVRR